MRRPSLFVSFADLPESDRRILQRSQCISWGIVAGFVSLYAALDVVVTGVVAAPGQPVVRIVVVTVTSLILTLAGIRVAQARTVKQIRERVAEEHRLAFLAEASRHLASSLDYEEVLQRFARLAVPEVGDWCSIWKLSEDGMVRVVATAHANPDREADLRALVCGQALPPDTPYGVPHVIRTGVAQHVPDVPPVWPKDLKGDRTHKEAFRVLAPRSVLIVPMVARGQTLGAMTLASAESGRRYTSADLRLAEDLALRAGLSLDNARLHREAQYRAQHDELTGLPNRSLLHERVSQAIEASRASGGQFALLLMDLNRFKEVNDTLGHPAGDELLRSVAKHLQAVSRTSDTVARLGGDEFAVLLRAVGSVEEARQVAVELLAAVEEPITIRDRLVDVQVSAGLCLYPDHGDDGETLLRCADVALYVAKRNAESPAVYEHAYDQHTIQRLELVAELRRDLDQNVLELHYQPIVELASGNVRCVEALARWRHERHGLIPADQFIPLAEETGLTRTLTRWVLATALRQIAVFETAGLGLAVSINLSMRDVHDATLPDLVARLLAEHHIPADRLRLEVTESAVMHDPRRALAVLTSLRKLGVPIALDDFGTGYSSLGYLKHLPADELKIDRSFMRSVVSDQRDRAIVAATIELAHQLDVKVVAEGVEDARAALVLWKLGCDAAQGFYFSRPLPAPALQEWLASAGRSGTTLPHQEAA